MSQIYCTDCHSDEVVSNNTLMSRGPHGSPYFPILRRQYMTMIGTAENLTNYGLCYRCHNQTSILQNDSFKATAGQGGHSGHLQSPTDNKPIPCSVCHDPHGVQDPTNGTGPTGSHTYLINFDNILIVQPLGANPYPIFHDNGNHSGSCTLECHYADMTVKIHNNATYP